MQLMGVELTNYRKYGLAEIAFPDGLIGIIGPNGAGKSTLMEAVVWALYGNPAARTQKEEIKRQGAADRDPCRVLLQLRLAGDEYLITRELKGKELSTEAVVSVNRIEVARGAQACSAYVASALGLDREAFFTSFFARQNELNSLSELSAGARKDLIIRMLGIDAIDRALDLARQNLREARTRVVAIRDSIPDRKVLSKEFRETKAESDRRKRNYDVLLAANKDIARAFEKAKEELREQEKKREDYLRLSRDLKLRQGELKMCRDAEREAREELAKLREARVSLKETEAIFSEYDSLRKKLDELADLQNKSQAYTELCERKERLNSKQKEYRNRVAKLREKSVELDLAQQKAQVAESELGELERGIERKREEKSAAQGALMTWEREEQKLLSELKQMVLLGGSKECPRCGRPLGNEFLEIRNHLEKESAAAREFRKESASKLSALDSELQMLQDKARLIMSEQKKLKEKEHEKRFLEREIGEIGSHSKETAEELRKILKQIDDLGEIEYSQTVHRELKDRFKDVSLARDRSLSARASFERLPALEAKLRKLNDRTGDLEKAVVSLQRQESSLAFSPSHFEESKAAFERKQEQRHETELSLRDCIHQCHLAEVRMTSLQKEMERCLGLQKEVSQLVAEQQYLDKLVGIYQDFRRFLIGRIRPALAQKAGDLLGELTDGRYSKMELGEDYEIFVFEQGERFPLERFSGGEKDLANLCLRLAISDLVSENAGNELGFIVLDEVFGSQDPQRKANIIRALSRLSSKFRQIFLVTHIDDVKDSMEHIITVSEGEDRASYAQLQ